MRKMLCAIAAAALVAGVANAGDRVIEPSKLSMGAKKYAPVNLTRSFTIDYQTGAVTPGGSVTDATLVYENVDPGATPTGLAGFPGDEIGDDLVLEQSGLLQELTFSFVNFSLVGDIEIADVEIRFYDYALTQIGSSLLVNLDFTGPLAPPLAPGEAVTLTIDSLGSANLNLPTEVFVTQIATITQGAGTDIGVIAADSQTEGWSMDAFYINGSGFGFDPPDIRGSFVYGVSVDVDPASLSVIHTTGAPNLCINASTLENIFLGWSSGDLSSANLPQRWVAEPFTVAANTTITKIDYYWFIVAGSEADNVVFRIWKRTGLNAPTQADEYATGTLGVYAAGLNHVDWFHTYQVNVPIEAGDYWFSAYAEGGAPDNNAAWLTGAHKQDEALEQAFIWRSQMYPAPGFLNYTTAAFMPGLSMTDTDDFYNPAFTLWGGGGCACVGDITGNCIVNQEDLGVLLSNYGCTAGCTKAQGDLTGDGAVNQSDLGVLLGDWGCGQ
jgi:hypothetical protein